MESLIRPTSQAHLVKIQRVQNKKLLIQYQAVKNCGPVVMNMCTCAKLRALSIAKTVTVTLMSLSADLPKTCTDDQTQTDTYIN